MLFLHARTPAPVRNCVRRSFLLFGALFLLNGTGLMVTMLDAAEVSTTRFSGEATPDKRDTDITAPTLQTPSIYNFSFHPSTNWTWYGTQDASTGMSAEVKITTQTDQLFGGHISVAEGVVDGFESAFGGELTPTGTGGTTVIHKPWNAYAWDHTIQIITKTSICLSYRQ